MEAFFEVTLGKALDVKPPVPRLLLDPLQQRLLEGRQAQEEMLSLPKLRRRAAKLAAGVDQLGRVHRLAAGVALIAAGAGQLARRADSFDIAVRQETPAIHAVRLRHRVFIEVVLVQQSEENVLDHGGVIGGAGGGVQVKVNTQPGEALDELLMKIRRNLGR